MIITRKIEIKFHDTEKEKMFRKWLSLMPKLHNTIVTNIFLNDIIKEKMANYDTYFQEAVSKIDKNITDDYESLRGCKDEKKRENGMKNIEKLKKERNKINFEGKKKFDEQFKEVFGKQFDGIVYNILRQDEVLAEIPSKITMMAFINLGFYKKSINAIKSGTERIRMYGKGMPMPIPKQAFSLNFDDESDKFTIKTVNDTKFDLYFGKDNSNNRVIVERCFDNIYRLADSQLQYIPKKKKWFLLACIDVPIESKLELSEDIVVGVDMGVKIPAYCALNLGEDKKALGTEQDMIKFRNGIRKQRRTMQRNLSTTGKNGQGTKRKMQPLERLADKERGFVKNYNHKISKEIIKFAVKNKAKYINLELLEGFGKDEDGKSIEKYKWMCSNWSYFELKTMIEYKAGLYGIIVRYIDPYHTSQTCSICGHFEEGQRLTQAQFICKGCGEEMNADLNAAKNIARSTKFVTERKECEYYKKNKKDVDKEE
jgi:putative transposase